MSAFDQVTIATAPDRQPVAPSRPALGGTQRQRETVVAAVVVIGLVAVCGLWWADTPGRALHTTADRLTAAGRLTGLAGTYLVLVQVVLMARLPLLDRLIGTDRLTAWHRANGAYSIALLGAHTVFIVLGYAAADHFSVAHESAVLVRSYPDVLAATAALGLLVGVGISSVRLARRKLRYESWYMLHLYTYLAIALSFAHQFATGNEFATHPASRVLWVTLYAVVAVLLIGYRLAVPMRDALRHDLRVASVVRETTDAVSIYMTGRDLGAIGAEAGQFFRWRFLTRDRWWRSHPFSLSASPNADFLRITVKGVGDDTRSFATIRPGTRVLAEGPYGNFTARRRRRTQVLLIAGGVGITPLRALVEEMPARSGDLALVYRATRERDVLFRSELEQLARAKGVALHFVLGRRDKNVSALSAPHLRRLVPDVAHRDVYVCGPPGMIAEAARSLEALGVPRGHIHTERFEL